MINDDTLFNITVGASIAVLTFGLIIKPIVDLIFAI